MIIPSCQAEIPYPYVFRDADNESMYDKMEAVLI